MDHRSTKRMWKEWAREQKGWGKEQFRYAPFFEPHRRERGTLKVAILMVLQEEPRHGYAIMKAIADAYGYAPSSGIVYPTLQLLEDQGCIAMREEDNKKVYSLTGKGQEYLETHQDVVNSIRAIVEQPKWSSLPGVGIQLSEIAKMILANFWALNNDKIKRIEDILEEARKHVGEVIFER
ncbi:MAG: PadR family transcriptional regulator [Halobacteriota archaeon]